MTELLCASPACRPPGRHTTECKTTEKPCRGCLPARAADGLWLCWFCINRVGRDALSAADLWAELGLVMTSVRFAEGEVKTRTLQTGLNPDERIIWHRSAIRHGLVSITAEVAKRRGLSVPWRWHYLPLPPGVEGPVWRVRRVDQTNHALARFVGDHSQWIAGQDFAGEVAGELASLVSVGRSLRQHSGTRVTEVGPCPRQIDDEGDGDARRCPGVLRALLRRHDSLLPSAVTCDYREDHAWNSAQWIKLGRLIERRKHGKRQDGKAV